MSETPYLSIVVPIFNEEKNLRPLVDRVRRAVQEGPEWELLLVDDGSVDGTAAAARRLGARDPRIRLLRLTRNFGQTAAMRAGFDRARGEVVVSMDGDLQNDPRDVPRLIRRLEEGYDLVAGYRESRKDPLLIRKFPSWVANRLIRWLTGVSIRDTGCSLRAYRREVLDRLPLYADMHRFIPALAAATAGARITEIPVRHHPRRHGESKYGLSRIWKVLADLGTVKMIRTFRERPLIMFGLGATASTLLGLLFAAGAVLAAPAGTGPGMSAPFVLPAAALLWLGLAFYLLMLGLIGEVALREHWSGDSIQRPVVREAALTEGE